MPIFEFKDDAYLLGKVCEVDSRKISLQVNNDNALRKARVGQLVTLALMDATESWLIGMIDRVVKSVLSVYDANNEDRSEQPDNELAEQIVSRVHLTLVGTVHWNAYLHQHSFSRSVSNVPEIDSDCYVLRDAQLESVMKVLATAGNQQDSLELGQYTLDDSATAYLEGNKFFQRHAAILGSTGSGKSWTVASILERSAKLPSANLIVFDLHGEYKKLSYAKQLRIPGPDALGTRSEDLLYLPYWLLNADEMQAMFIDRSEFSAYNQVMAFQNAIIELKKATLTRLGKHEVLKAFTLDSPVPFSVAQLIDKLRSLNQEMVASSRGLKPGQFFGQFSRLLTRLNSKLTDNRYGFLFNAPASEQAYDAMAILAAKLMDYSKKRQQIKIIDFSEVPAEILPIIVGIVARLIYQIQFWTPHQKRRPIALVCDEAQLYLSKGQNPIEIRAIETFEKIAKEGRKYGVALLIISQRPSDMSPTILSQCNNVIALRLTNAEDQQTVRKLLSESLESLLETLPIMEIGEAFVVGDAVLLPSRIKLNPPQEKPVSATIDFWSEWLKEAEKPDFVNAIENLRQQKRK
jgi:hypothetical protein